MSVTEFLSDNSTRLTVCTLTLCAGLIVSLVFIKRKQISSYRSNGNEHLWVFCVVITICLTVGLWFGLSDSVVDGKTNKEGKNEKRTWSKRSSHFEVDDVKTLENFKSTRGSEQVFPRLVFADSGVINSGSNKVDKRFIPIPVLVPGLGKKPLPDKRNFFQKNSKRLVATSSSTVGGAGGTYAGRRQHKYMLLIGILSVLVVGVALWFAIGEDELKDPKS